MNVEIVASDSNASYTTEDGMDEHFCLAGVGSFDGRLGLAERLDGQGEEKAITWRNRPGACCRLRANRSRRVLAFGLPGQAHHFLPGVGQRLFLSHWLMDGTRLIFSIDYTEHDG